MEHMETFHGKVFQYSTWTIFHGLRGQKRTSRPWILSMESMDQIHSPWTHSMEFMEILHGQYLGRLFSGLLWKNWKSSMEARFNTPHGKFSMESIEIHGECSPGKWKIITLIRKWKRHKILRFAIFIAIWYKLIVYIDIYCDTPSLICMTCILEFYYAPRSNDWGHIVFVPSVCLFVCLSVCLLSTLTFAKTFEQ